MVKRPVDILPPHPPREEKQASYRKRAALECHSLLNQPPLGWLRCVTLRFWTQSRSSLLSRLTGCGRSEDDEATGMLGGHGHCDAVALELPSAEKVSC